MKKQKDVLAERSAAREAFSDYCLLGSTRSLNKLVAFYKDKHSKGFPVPTRTYNTVERWCSQFGWVKRAEEWDAAQRAIREEEWRERQRELRELDWEAGNKLRGLFDQLIETAPKFIKQKRQFIQGAPGQPDKEIITLAIREDMLTRLAETASALQGKAVGTERTATIKPDGEGGLKITAFDYNSAIDVLKPESPEEVAVEAATQYLLHEGQNRNSSESDVVDAESNEPSDE